MKIISFGCAVAAMVLAVAPAVAQDAEAGKMQVVTYTDLNLATAGGQATLARRIHAAIKAVCYANGSDLSRYNEERDCRKYAGAHALDAMRQAITMRQTSVQLASR